MDESTRILLKDFTETLRSFKKQNEDRDERLDALEAQMGIATEEKANYVTKIRFRRFETVVRLKFDGLTTILQTILTWIKAVGLAGGGMLTIIAIIKGLQSLGIIR